MLTASLVLIAALPALQAAQAAQAARPPNVVIVFCDDLGYGDLGCYGHPTIRTPNLDRMAAEGARFTEFYSASSVCSPSRAALLTGRLPVRSGMCGHRQRAVMRSNGVGGLPPEEITLAEALKARGYATCALGKWHLGHLPEHLPARHGFDRFVGMPYSNDMRPYYWIRGEERVDGEVDQSAITGRLTDEAIAFMREHREQPFFVYLAHAFPHTPLHASAGFRGKSARGLYGDVVAELDASTGRIVAELRALGIAEQTVVLFTSDNGPWLIRGVNGGSAGLLRDGKGSTFEGGMRVPAIAWAPGRITPGTVVRHMASTMDLFATCVRLAGGALPDDRTYDSHDLAPVLFDGGERTTREHVLFYRGKEVFAVRRGLWKAHFVTQPAYGKGERQEHDPPLLFHLGRDPSEQHDVAAANPEVVAELRTLVAEHVASFEPPPSQLERF